MERGNFLRIPHKNGEWKANYSLRRGLALYGKLSFLQIPNKSWLKSAHDCQSHAKSRKNTLRKVPAFASVRGTRTLPRGTRIATSQHTDREILAFWQTKPCSQNKYTSRIQCEFVAKCKIRLKNSRKNF